MKAHSQTTTVPSAKEAFKMVSAYMVKRSGKIPLNQYGKINRKMVLKFLNLKGSSRTNKNIKALFDSYDKSIDIKQSKVSSNKLTSNFHENTMFENENIRDIWFADHGLQVII